MKFDLVLQEEQIMYPSSLENERFVVALVRCRGTDAHSWEITRALKYE